MVQFDLIYNIFTAIGMSIDNINLTLLTMHCLLRMKVTFVLIDFSFNTGELYLWIPYLGSNCTGNFKFGCVVWLYGWWLSYNVFKVLLMLSNNPNEREIKTFIHYCVLIHRDSHTSYLSAIEAFLSCHFFFFCTYLVKQRSGPWTWMVIFNDKVIM